MSETFQDTEESSPNTSTPGRLKVIKLLAAVVGAAIGVAAWQLIAGPPGYEKFGSGEGGVLFKDAAGRFSVTFPDEPKKEEQKNEVKGVGQLNTIMHMVDEGEYTFGVSYSDFPAGSSFSLDGSVQGAVDAVGGTLLSSSPRNLGPHSGITFDMESSDGVPISQWVILSGNRFYQVQVVGVPKGAPSISRFFDSFQIAP